MFSPTVDLCSSSNHSLQYNAASALNFIQRNGWYLPGCRENRLHPLEHGGLAGAVDADDDQVQFLSLEARFAESFEQREGHEETIAQVIQSAAHRRLAVGDSCVGFRNHHRGASVALG